jgi:hypothetical protein
MQQAHVFYSGPIGSYSVRHTPDMMLTTTGTAT